MIDLIGMLEPEKQATTADPLAEAVARYREAVFSVVESGGSTSAEPDTSMLADACRTAIDFKKDCERYCQRVKAADDLNTRVPQLETKALGAEKAAIHAGDILKAPVANYATVGELRAALVEAELFLQAEPSTRNNFRPGLKTPQQMEARERRQAVESLRRRAMEILFSTAARDEESIALRNERGGISAAIANRCRPDLAQQIESARAKMLKLVHELDAGDYADHRTQLVRAKEHLDKLEVMAAEESERGQPDNSDELRRLAEIDRRLTELESKRLDPKNMNWG